jgi:pyruvate dehydrogenase E2 component (dihydrolipoamide acetyltransferase)
MAKRIALPKIGVNMTEAVITRWLVTPGDAVRDGDPVLEAETDKATQEICATEDGVIAELIAQEGDTVQCGEDIFVIREEGEEYTPGAAAAAAADAADVAAAAASAVTGAAAADAVAGEGAGEGGPVGAAAASAARTDAPGVADGARLRVSPLAKKMAKEQGVDLSLVAPKTPGGRIVGADVAVYARTPVSAGAPVGGGTAVPGGEDGFDVVPMSPMRKTIAARMSESASTKPSAALTVTADASVILRLRARRAALGSELSVDAILAKIVSLLIRRHPQVNARLEGDDILIGRGVHVGVAVDTPKGLTVVVIRDADKKALVDIAAELAEKGAAAREAKLAEEHMSGGTFTLTNLGMFGIEQFTPIINPPECCILSIGAIRESFVPDAEGRPVSAKVFQMTLVFDHRIIDGAPAARFLRDVKAAVEMPALLL